MNKFKQSVPYLLIVIFTGWFSYKFFVERKTPTQPSMALDWDQLDSTSGSAPQKNPSTLRKVDGASHMQDHNTLTKADEAEFAEIDLMEGSWLTTVESIIGRTDYPRYIELRDANEKEKTIAYQEYHDYLRKEFGDKFEYNISEDQSIREKEINKRYLKELLALVGNEKFQTYLKARDKINEENRRNNKAFFQIEF